jgi:uncharacterized protein YcnI
MRGHRRGLAAAVLVALAVPAGAAGHATVQPGASRPADVQVYRVTVPNEADSDTTEVRLRVPAGFAFVLAEAPPAGWKAELVRRGGRLREIRWHGGRIAPGFFGTFRFLARNPVEEGEVRWPVVQAYAGGDVVRWIGPAGSEEPASVTRISESAAPVDTVSVHSGDASAAPAGGAGRAPAAAVVNEDGESPLPIILGGVALLVALAGLGISLRGRRAASA